MLDEVGKALGPWPILQVFFGMAVLGVGAYALVRGVMSSKSGDRVQLEDKRMEWEAYERLRQIEENTAQIAANQRAMLEGVRHAVQEIRLMTEQMKALAAAIWNRGV
jgi:hypothetical protein